MAIQYWRIRDRYYRLIGNKCEDCSAEFFPPVYRCRKCKSDKLVDVEMPKTGKIMTYTQLHEPMPGFEEQAPLFLAVMSSTAPGFSAGSSTHPTTRSKRVRGPGRW